MWIARQGKLSNAWSSAPSRGRHTRCLSDWSSDVCSSYPSRRRHTRCLSDWSSDVCSSDPDQPDRRRQGSARGGGGMATRSQIGRASCRGRGEISVGGGLFKKKKKTQQQ